MSISLVNNKIRIAGTETGDSLRAFAASSPHATVNGRSIVFNVSLELRNNYNFTDTNSSYIFMGDAKLEGKAGGEINFTDVLIRYEGNMKLHTFMFAHTQNFTRVTYIQGVLDGRSDFFNNGDFTFNYNDVNLVSYGRADFLHFQTTQTINDLTVVNAAGGLNFEPCAANLGESMTINNLKLVNVTKFTGGIVSQGACITNDMQWDKTVWRHSTRNAIFQHINPIKPPNWSRYAINGSPENVTEYYTHDVKIVKENNVPVEGSQILLGHRANAQDSFADTDIRYSLTTDSSGRIPQQNVLTWNDNITYADFDLRVVSYTQQIGGGLRALQNGQIDETIVTQTDASLTEMDKSIVDAYAEISNSKELYDAIKAYQVDNYTGEVGSLVTRDGGSIDLGVHDIRVRENLSVGLVVETLASGNLNFIIKGSNYTGDLKTTGLIGGSSLNWVGRREDKNGIIERQKILTFTGLIEGSEVRVYSNDLSQELGGIEYSGTSLTVAIEDNSVTYVIHHIEYEYIRLENVDTSADTTITIKQRFDRVYSNE